MSIKLDQTWAPSNAARAKIRARMRYVRCLHPPVPSAGHVRGCSLLITSTGRQGDEKPLAIDCRPTVMHGAGSGSRHGARPGNAASHEVTIAPCAERGAKACRRPSRRRLCETAPEQKCYTEGRTQQPPTGASSAVAKSWLASRLSRRRHCTKTVSNFVSLNSDADRPMPSRSGKR